ncbi:GNAT family N-acyltransferase [Desulfobulbus elongatus]|uniref:GNAT family N-acyltransferase n=1 Tax=Desulfobulbus elongatus TaxID=53332 RepID=UPI000483C3D1|nr:lysophospholipid acyltransferase family protein [Desulfobulbus elongatus]
MFTVDALLNQYYPRLANRPLVTPPVRTVLRRLLREDRFLRFAEQYPHLKGMDFVEQVLETLHCTYTVSDRDRENIPASGRVVIVANHPIGSLDGLALLKLVHDSRPDTRIVANDLLEAIEPLHPCLLSVKVMTGHARKEQLARIDRALANEEAIIIFPAGEVSRLSPKGIQDGPWHKGFLRMAARAKAPILPIHVHGRNSFSFYATSMLVKPLSTLMLVGEMFHQRRRPLKLTIGGLIPHAAYDGLKIRERDKVDLFRRHLYRIGAGKRGVLPTETAIARPERRVVLKKTVQAGELLGKTPDNKAIYLFEGDEQSPVLREIARLREMTFRAVGEGSGRRRDMDRFDRYYRHLVLWSEEDLEIVGAYRLADAAAVVREHDCEGLYSHSLFQFEPSRFPYLDQGLELGRSFVQQRYWGKRSLDYLWYGIGAFLRRNPQYRYLFGPVSISNAMPQMAKELLIYFYKLYFSTAGSQTCSRNPFRFSLPVTDLARSFQGDNYQQDLVHLKSMLAAMGTSIPTLYKQYTELCLPGGVVFLDFNVDRDFGDCVDGLVVVDTAQLKPNKRNRYIEESVLTAG